MTLEEAAKHLKSGKSTVHRLARESDLPAYQMGRE
ncbi:MAG: helix-turn-helix domain-containing protein [Candidatus Zixiibacteriota bacterium]